MPASVVQNLEGAQNTGLATVTVNHSAAAAGSLLILVVGADDYRTTSGSGRPESSGYTLPTGGAQQTFLGHYVWYKVAAGGETSVQYTIGSAAPSCWEFYEVSGLDAAPYDTSNGQFAASSATSYTTPAITPSAGERWLFGSIGGSLSSALSGVDTWLNSFVELNDTFTTLASGTRDLISGAAVSVTANGSTAYSTGATYSGAVSPQARTGIILAFKVAAAGTAFTRTVDDSAGLTDSASAVSGRAQSATDAAGLADSRVVVLSAARPVTDAVGMGDATSAVSTWARSAADTAGLTDSVAPQLSGGTAFTQTVDDGAGLVDSRELTQAATAADSAGLADSVTQQSVGAGARTATDSAGLSDAVTYSSTAARTDVFGPADTVALAVAAARSAADVLGVTDSVQITVTRAVSVSDIAGITDTVSAVASLGNTHVRVVSDRIGMTSQHQALHRAGRPSSGVTARPSSGVTARPYAGVTSRYSFVPD